MVNCGACGKFLSPAGAAACSGCPTKYHKACLGVTDKTQIARDWVCPLCKKSSRKGDNTQTPVKAIFPDAVTEVAPPSSNDPGVRLIPSGSADAQNPAPRSVSSEIPDNQDFRQDFSTWIVELREHRKEMALLRESLTKFTVRLEDVERRVETLEKSQSDGNSDRVRELERTLCELRSELNDRDQEALLADLDIGLLPEERSESTTHAVMVLAGRLGVTLDERDVVFAERVGVPPAETAGRPRRVIVRLARRDLRDQLLQAARVRRVGLGSAAAPRVYVNERLTRSNRQLFHRVREECRRLQWRYSWTRRGRICARQGDGKPVFQFRCDADLLRAFGAPEQHPK